MKAFLSTRPESRSTNQKIFFAAVTVAVVGMLAKAGMTAKELLVAKVFGRGDDLDAFLIAFLLPAFIVNLAMGSLSVAFLPMFVETREKHGAQASQKLFSNVLLLSVAALAVLTAMLGVFAPYYLTLLGSNFSPAKLLLTRMLLYWVLPFVLFNGVSLFITSALNAGEKFALPALVPLITPLITITLLAAAHTLGVFSLAIGVVTGSVLEAAVLIRSLQSHNLSARLRWYGMDERVRRVLAQFAPACAGSFLMGSTVVVDQAMAGMLPPGSVSALSYANKFVGLIIAVCAAALSTATAPYFSRMVANRQWTDCRHTIKKFSILVFAGAVPMTVFLIAFSQPVVRLLFQRGTFSAADTALVSKVQVCYALQIPFYICGMLFVRFLSSMKRNEVLMYGSLVNTILNVILNFVFIRFWGLPGIALSTSCVYLFSFSFLGINSIRLITRAARSETAAGDTKNILVEAPEPSR
jgi:putative peptidoglycan lipid II flippase